MPCGGLLVGFSGDHLARITQVIVLMEDALTTLPALAALASKNDEKRTGNRQRQATLFISEVLQALVADFCIEIRPARWISDSLYFLPCESEGIGLAALTFVDALLELQESMASAKENSANVNIASNRNQLYEAVGLKYQACRLEMRAHGLNQSNIAVAPCGKQAGYTCNPLAAIRQNRVDAGAG